MFLEELKKNNQYPIVFIGSGITKRYFKDAPDWKKLLQILWNRINSPENFFGTYELLKMENNGDEFLANTQLAEKIEADFNEAFWLGKTELNNLSIQEASETSTSPFRKAISNIFANLEFIEEKREELAEFTKVLQKSRIIITTNYDLMIENLLSNSIKVNIGGPSLFKQSNDMNELFKIHGSIDNPNTIVITEQDYKRNDKTSALVNAKILSSLIESPIIFLGYSLSDVNIRKLLQDFSDNLPDDLHLAANRIAVVEYSAKEQFLNEGTSEIQDLNIHYTKFETDNYKDIYTSLASVNQGLTPNAISKYQKMFRKIIEVKGQQGELDTVLTNFVDMSNLPAALKSKNLVIAFGDSRYIYKTPDYIDYIKAYFNPSYDFPTEIALNFISKYSSSSTLPITRFIKAANGGFDVTAVKKIPTLTEKIRKRNERFPSIQAILSSINKIGSENSALIRSLGEVSPLDLYLDTTKAVNQRNKVRYITLNIQNYNLGDLTSFTNYLINSVPAKSIEATEYRKYFAAFSFMLDPEITNLTYDKTE